MLSKNAGLQMSYSDSYNRIAAQKRLKDYDILAFACRRAGKSRDEGRAYYSTGVLYDNLGKYKMAVDSYKKFLQVCKAIGDVHGEALAYTRRTRGQLRSEDDDPPDMTAVDILAIETREVTTVLTLPTLGGWLGVADIAWPRESGVTILYKSDRYDYDLIRADGERSTVHAIAGPKYSVHCCELSPDARYVAAASVFSSPDDSQMRVVDLATGESHDFTRGPDTVDQESADENPGGNRVPFSGWLESPSWSSDGTQVAFVHPEGRWECCDHQGFSTLTGGPTTVWRVTIGESVATPIVSFDSNESQRLSHDLAWPPGY